MVMIVIAAYAKAVHLCTRTEHDARLLFFQKNQQLASGSRRVFFNKKYFQEILKFETYKLSFGWFL